MLVKLAYVMQRLKKYLQKFCHDLQRWGGGHRAHGGLPQSPLGKTLPCPVKRFWTLTEDYGKIITKIYVAFTIIICSTHFY